MKSLKMEGFKWSTVAGFFVFVLLAFKAPSESLGTIGQFWFGFQGIVSGGFFGFRAMEQTAKSKNGNIPGSMAQ